MTATTRQTHTAVLLAAIVLLGAIVPLVAFTGVGPAAAAPTTIRVPTDQPTIQDAVDSAAPGDVVEVENGTYVERITIEKDLRLTNAPGASPTIRSPGLSPSLPDPLLLIPGPGTVTVSGIAFDIDAVRNSFAVEVRGSSTSVTLEDVSVSNGTLSRTAVVVQGLGTLSIRDSHIESGDTGISVDTANLNVHRSVVTDTREDGVRVDDSQGTVTISNSTVSDTEGIGIVDSHVTISNSTVSDTFSVGGSAAGVEVRTDPTDDSSESQPQNGRVEIFDTIVDGAEIGVNVTDQSTATLRNVSIQGTNDEGLYVRDANVTLLGSTVSDVDGKAGVRYNDSAGAIENSTVDPIHTNATVIEGPSNVSILDSSLVPGRFGDGFDGTVVDGNASVTVADTHVMAGTGVTAVAPGSATLTVHNSTFDVLNESIATAFEAATTTDASAVSITNNTFGGPGQGDAVRVLNTPATITGNEIAVQRPNDEFDRAIHLVDADASGGSVGSTVSRNDINATALSAIRLVNTTATVANNSISNTSLSTSERAHSPDQQAAAAVRGVGSTSLTMTGNDVDDAYGYGVYLSGTPHGTIAANQINATGTDGIFAVGSGNVIVEDNVIGGAGLANQTSDGGIGVWFDGSVDGALNENVIVQANDTGVRIASNQSVTIRDNRLVNARLNGIKLFNGGQKVVTNNSVDVSSSGSTGIAVKDGARASVVDNVVTDGEVGIVVGDFGVITRLEYNDLSDPTVGLDYRRGAGVDASLNYWGEDGPGADQTSGSVSTVDPFLTAPPSEIDRGDLKAFGYRLDLSDDHVYAFGTPAPLERNLSATFTDFDGVVYLYDASSESWQLATGDETLDAMEGVVVVPENDTRAVVDFSDATPVRPTTRDLEPGWNFVAPRSYETARPAMAGSINSPTDLLAPFAQPHGQPAPPGESFAVYSYAEVIVDDPRVSPFTGYFLFVTESGEIPGHVADGTTLSIAEEALNIDGSTGLD